MIDARFPARVVRLLQDAAIDTWIFGGWAEELLGLTAPRPHQDLDLLHPADDWSVVDGYLATMDEVVAKRFPHKRAFVLEQALVEIFLVQRDRDGVFTLFDGARHGWPDDTFNDRRAVPVASAASVLEFRRNYREASTIASP